MPEACTPPIPGDIQTPARSCHHPGRQLLLDFFPSRGLDARPDQCRAQALIELFVVAELTNRVPRWLSIDTAFTPGRIAAIAVGISSPRTACALTQLRRDATRPHHAGQVLRYQPDRRPQSIRMPSPLERTRLEERSEAATKLLPRRLSAETPCPGARGHAFRSRSGSDLGLGCVLPSLGGDVVAGPAGGRMELRWPRTASFARPMPEIIPAVPGKL